MPDGADELSTTLRHLRKAAGLTGMEAARLAGVSQASVSRWENGRNVPTRGDVLALARVYGAPAAETRRMEQLVADVRDSPHPPARLTMRRAADMQRRIGRIEQGSAELRSFHPLLVPGLLQTAAYARVVFASGDDIAVEDRGETETARIGRADVLHDGRRTLIAVLTAGALRWPMGSFATMAEQIDHVIALSRRPNVHVGVVTGATPVNVAPVHGFDLFDLRVAVVGIETATAFLTDTRDIDALSRLFESIQRLAVFGDEARAELVRAAELYRPTE